MTLTGSKTAESKLNMHTKASKTFTEKDTGADSRNLISTGKQKTSPLHSRKKSPKGLQVKDQNLITFKSLQEGDQFDKDIKRIMNIIGNVEKEFGEKRINTNFKKAVNTAYQRRLVQIDHDDTVQQTLVQGAQQKLGSRTLSQKEEKLATKQILMPRTFTTNMPSGSVNMRKTLLMSGNRSQIGSNMQKTQ